MKHILLLLIAALTIGCDQSPETPKAGAETKGANGKVFEYGIYDAQRKGKTRTDIATNTGKVITKSVLKLNQTTNRIPLLKDTYFAYRFRLLDLPKEDMKKPVVKIRKVLIHPKMTLADGSTTTGWDRVVRARTSISQVIAFDGYALNEDYELVEGDWIFQIWFNEQKLVEQTFTTYFPEQVHEQVHEQAPETATIQKSNLTKINTEISTAALANKNKI